MKIRHLIKNLTADNIDFITDIPESRAKQINKIQFKLIWQKEVDVQVPSNIELHYLLDFVFQEKMTKIFDLVEYKNKWYIIDSPTSIYPVELI